MSKERKYRISCYAADVPLHKQCLKHFAPRTKERSDYIYAREAQKIAAGTYTRVVQHQGNFKRDSYRIVQDTQRDGIPFPVLEPKPPAPALSTTVAGPGVHDAAQDRALLARLAERLNAREPGLTCGRVSKVCGRFKRDQLMVAYRWLRRFIGGDWHRSGHHVGRFFMGPMLGERHGRFSAER